MSLTEVHRLRGRFVFLHHGDHKAMGTGENTRQLVESTSRTSGRWPGERRALGKTQVMAITGAKSSSRRKRDES